MDLASTLTIVGMVVVFAALVVLAFAISLLSKVININKNADTEKPADVTTSTVNTGTANTDTHTDNRNDEELIAVITAAIMASMKQCPDFKIRVKSFRRIPNNSPEWNVAGRLATINKC